MRGRGKILHLALGLALLIGLLGIIPVAVIVETVRKVEDVLPDRPVDALYIEMGDSAMVFRVRWWIESYVDTRRVINRVHTASQHALEEAGLNHPTQLGA